MPWICKRIYHSILSPVSARVIVSSTGPLGTRTKRPGTKHSETIRKGQKCSEGQNILGTKRLVGQNIKGKNVWKQDACGTKHPWGQSVRRDKISGEPKGPFSKFFNAHPRYFLYYSKEKIC